MAGFIYFAEASVTPTLDKCQEWGLGYAFNANPMARQVTGRTPSGRPGYVFADGKRVSQLKCDTDAQEWRKIPGQDVWVGYWRDDKPTPADLARAEQLTGYALQLADGHEWLIPVVRAFDVETETPQSVLPALYDLDETGRLVLGEVQAAHRWLWDLTEPAWQAMVAGGDVTDQSMLETACKLISANYVAGLTELAALLQVFSPVRSPAGIVAIAVDQPTFARWLAKKNETNHSTTDAGSSSSAGEAA